MGQELPPAVRRSRARSESFPVSRRRWLQPERSWQKRGQRSRRVRHSVLQGTLAGYALATSRLHVRRRRASLKAAESPSRANPSAPTSTATTRFSAYLQCLRRPGGQIHPRVPPPRPPTHASPVLTGSREVAKISGYASATSPGDRGTGRDGRSRSEPIGTRRAGYTFARRLSAGSGGRGRTRWPRSDT